MGPSFVGRIFGNGSIYETLATDDVELHASRQIKEDYGRSTNLGPVMENADEDNEVPPSLLVEDSPPEHQRIVEDRSVQLDRRGDRAPPTQLSIMSLTAEQKAQWRWANVQNLDAFLQEVSKHGPYDGTINTRTLAFVVCFSFYLGICIDFSAIESSKSLADVTKKQCFAKMSPTMTMFVFLFSVFWGLRLLQMIQDIPNLWEMHNFYGNLLNLTEADLSTISWYEITTRLMSLRESNAATANALSGRNIPDVPKERMDAHDIANRIMRKENYMIALINNDVLDLRVPWSFFRNKPFLTRTLEWNINLCIMDYFFDSYGQFRPIFTSDYYRKQLSESLRRRFIFAGIMNVAFAPFIIVYLLLLYFFRYFNEYHKNPASLGSRQFTTLALWKFREFNELPHAFDKRIKMCYPLASKYVDQFPKDIVTQLSRFVGFIAGSFVAVLVLASLLDPDMFNHFEITKDRSASFYILVFGAILAVSRAMIPEDLVVLDTEEAIKEVCQITHHMPPQWTGRLHSVDVKQEFCRMYDLKVSIFLWELLSVLFTPIILWFSLPPRSEDIVDFFRQFSVHVDGIGPPSDPSKCNLAEHPDPNESKMEKSILNFKAQNPRWQPRSGRNRSNPPGPSADLYGSSSEATFHLNSEHRKRESLNGSLRTEHMAGSSYNGAYSST